MSNNVMISTRLQELEQTIERGFNSFIDVANALLEVRNDKRFEERGYATFEDYCRGRWGIAIIRARQMMRAIQVVKNLQADDDTRVSLPDNEKQLRPLVRLEAEQQREVWDEATTNNHQPTEQQVREIVERKFPKVASPEQVAKLARIQSASELGSMLLALSLTPKTSRQLASDLLDYDEATFNSYVGKKITRAVLTKAVKTLTLVAKLWRSKDD